MTKGITGTPQGGLLLRKIEHYYSLLEKPTMKQTKIFSAFILIILTTFFLGLASTAKSESTGQYIDDSVITTKVKSKIVEDLSLKGFQVSVKTYKGVVQLSGFVDTQANINKATDIAGHVEGVKSVKNDLELKK
jgi:hypothetical protein